jgi:hypothetical protein
MQILPNREEIEEDFKCFQERSTKLPCPKEELSNLAQVLVMAVALCSFMNQPIEIAEVMRRKHEESQH